MYEQLVVHLQGYKVALADDHVWTVVGKRLKNILNMVLDTLKFMLQLSYLRYKYVQCKLKKQKIKKKNTGKNISQDYQVFLKKISNKKSLTNEVK